MANGKVDFKIPGRPAPVRAEEQLGNFAKITVRESYQIRPPTRGAEDLLLKQYDPNALIELEFESGAKRYMRADQLAADLAGLQPERGGPTQTAGTPIIVPTAWGGTARGDSELLAAFRLLDISPWDPVIEGFAKEAAETGAAKIAAFFERNLNAGLYQVTDPREVTNEVTDAIGTAPAKPILLLLHGTASNTAGSFSGLAGKNEWKQFLSDYDRILALEHRTFSVSPIQNAMDAAKLLPTGATLHLLSHSRGGLVGELLCLSDIRSNQIADFKRRRPQQAEELEKLAALLREKKFQVERFVRVACPSRGTLLASDRLDLYFSLLLKVIEYVPVLHENIAYAVFKATFLKLIEMKASPEHVPGIEAMRPESPLIALLNRPDLSTQADLAVIAGRTEGFTLSWRSLAKLASDAFYREANDFVVNTEAMYWGMQRQNRGFYFSDRGSDVSHFNYFQNDRTRKQAAAWLSRAADRPPNLFVDLTLRLRKDLMFPEWRGEDKRPVLIYIPPAMGTWLKGPRGRVWLQVPGLLPGDLDEIADLTRLTTDGVVPHRCHRLLEYLNGSFAIKLFEYDWRQALAVTVESLTKFIRTQQDLLKDSARPLAILAFSSGGVLLHRLSGQDTTLWQELQSRSTRMVVLGDPRQAVQQAKSLIDGSNKLLKLLEFVDGRKPAETAEIFKKLPGLTELAADQSEPLMDPIYVFGRSPGSEPGLGDANVWYASVPHGNLADHPLSFEAIRDLLTSGKTARLCGEPLPQPLAGVSVPHLYPTEAELFDAAFAADPEPATEPPLTIHAHVRHAHLREAGYPVTVGHYEDDVIVSAEKVLDEQLGGRLSNRFHMDLYPGRDGTYAILEAPDSSPPGALVIGLGKVGTITAEKVRNGVTTAALAHALALLEAAGTAIADPISVGISSVLLGTYGGNALSVRNSVTAIIDGVVQANRTLSSRLGDRVRVDGVEIIELYEDLAIQAARELVRLEDRLREYADERVVLNADRYLRVGSTGQFHRPVDPYVFGWWRRIGITQKDGKFSFTSLTERARAEQNVESRQLPLVDDLVRETIATTTYDEDLSTMLFEVLLPNDVKDQMRDEASLVLVVDESSAGYPWELLAQRTRKTVKPLATSFGMLRQFTTPAYRPHPRSSRQNTAFVVGNPETSSHSELPKAREEALSVTAVLESQGYEVKLLKDGEASARSVLTQLFAREHRILHLAGHGQYNPKDPLSSGLILSRGRFLTSAEINQLRVLPELVFLNCCYLGEHKNDSDIARLSESQPNLLAASLARQLINMGVKAVIAAGWAVDDDAALTFATTFYKEMLKNNETFGQAVLKARQETAGQHPGSNTWGAYQCYGNPDFSLSPPQDGQSKEEDGSLSYVARQECLDRLHSLQSMAQGATDAMAVQLTKELARIESGIPRDWLDGEVLDSIAAVYGKLVRWDDAIDTYTRAIADPSGRQPFKAVEQLLNLIARSAGKQPGKARTMWKDAEKLLDGITSLGDTPERLSLAGGLYKRIADAELPSLDVSMAMKAIKSYDEAAKRYQEIHGRPYPYPILNSIALNLMLQQNFNLAHEKQRAQEALQEAQRLAGERRDVWDRVALPDALVIVHLLEDDLAAHVESILAKYQFAMEIASAQDKESIRRGLEFLDRRIPSEPLKAILQKLGK